MKAICRGMLAMAGAAILTAAAACHATPEQEKAAYLQARSWLIDADEHGFSPPMSAVESAADAKLQELKTRERERMRAIAPGTPFLKIRGMVAQSPLMPLLREMPKGAILHAHPGALQDFHWLIKTATYRPDCYVADLGTRDALGKPVTPGTLKLSATPPGTGWQSVAALRAQAADAEAFDESLYETITLGPEDFGTSKGVWREFEDCWERVGGLQSDPQLYEPFLRRELLAAAEVGYQILELRAFLGGPDRSDGKGNDFADTIATYKTLEAEVREKYPDFRLGLIYSREKNDPATVAKYLKNAVQLRKDFPEIVEGFDLVTEEDANHPLKNYVEVFLAANREAEAAGVRGGLPYFFHAGESLRNENENLFDAVLMGTRRIGHGILLSRHPLLMQIVKQRRIGVELCPISNQALGYVTDLRTHPGLTYLRAGLLVSLNPDDPGMMGYSPEADWYMALMEWDLSLADLKRLARNSILTSGLPVEVKRQALWQWEAKWAAWVARASDHL